jgi:hypothetical protein
LPAEARVEGNDVVLTTPVDPFFGLRVQRRIRLDPEQPVMSITTTFERVSGPPREVVPQDAAADSQRLISRGEPLDVSVWVVTQLKEPVRLFAAVPAQSGFEKGYALISKEPPPDLKLTNGLISLSRNAKAAHLHAAAPLRNKPGS